MNPDCEYCGFKDGASVEHECDASRMKKTIDNLYRQTADIYNGKAEVTLRAIREGDVGSDIIINNSDGTVFCILTIKCKEHPECPKE